MLSAGMRTALLPLILSAATLGSTEADARKVLAARCWACHAQTAMGELRLDSREAMLRGGKSGPAVVPGQPDKSRAWLAAARTAPGILPMPPGPALKAEELETLRAWIAGGAPWNDPSTHWAYRPLRQPAANESIDAVLARTHRTKSLTPNPPADRRTLIRRAAFDLTGLPPTEEQFREAFDDPRPDWFHALINRLQSTPHFGEKWARHWLDVARYGEDDFTGTEVVPYPNAWRYRDWVVDAINRDMPYDRFLMAQLAGDLMGDPALLPATGLLGLGPWYYGIAQPAQTRADERNDRVDMVTRGMLGVTVACARCHDHKYDPFSIKEYYALAGVFASTAYQEYPLVPPEEAANWKKHKEQVDAAEKALNEYLDRQAAELTARFAPRIADFMLAAAGAHEAPDLPASVIERWKSYLEKPEQKHPFLARWFAGHRDAGTAAAFQQLLLDIDAEKRRVDEENRRIVEEANRKAPPVLRTIVLPGGYRSEEDFNPGAEIPAKSLDRDRFVAWNRTFGDRTAPLKLDRELTAKLLDPTAQQEYERLKSAHVALKAALPPKYPFLHGAAEFTPWDLQLHKRGNPEDLGEVIPRGFPAALSNGEPVRFHEGSGRMELARIVAHHPLAARVAVNRIWLALFGQGIVATPSNFGNTGDRPAAPELLEHLAARFAQGYSVKAIVRDIMLSDAYRRSAARNPEAEKVDAANRYFWRQNRRRLEAEPLLDAMLAVSGELDRKAGGESAALSETFTRRAIYAKTGRFQPDETLALFDLPSALVTCEQRVVTTVPLQKLFQLNSGIAGKRAAALGARIARDDHNAGIAAAYHLLFHRPPTPAETRLGRDFLEQSGWAQYAWVLLNSNEFAYVD